MSETDSPPLPPTPADEIKVAPRSRGLNIVRRLLRSSIRLVLLVGVPVFAGLVGLHLYAKGGRFIETENAYVKANIIAISSDRDGRVTEVLVQDNEYVETSRELFHLDPESAILAVRQAEAQMEVVRTEIKGFQADYHESLARTEVAIENVRFMRVQLQRQERLRSKKLGRSEDFDAAIHELKLAEREVRLLEQRTQQSLAQLNGKPDSPVEQHPRYQRAITVRGQANMQLQRTTVVAPSSGVVSNMKLQVGEYVEEGKPIFSVIEAAPIWVEANLKETQLTHIVVGQEATISVDAYPDVSWIASVQRIAPATGAEFALLPPQNATGNWVKVVQRVPVRLKIQHRPGQPELRAGMTATVSIDSKQKRELPKFARQFLNDDGTPDFLKVLVNQALAFSREEDSEPAN